MTRGPVTPDTPRGAPIRWTGHRGAWVLVEHVTSPTAGPCATIRSTTGGTRTRPLTELRHDPKGTRRP